MKNEPFPSRSLVAPACTWRLRFSWRPALLVLYARSAMRPVLLPAVAVL